MTNILLVLVDELRADTAWHHHLGAVRTPHLDRLRREGWTCPEAFCQTPSCVPSRASLATGLYPHQLGVVNHAGRIPDHVPTWGHLLGEAGYQALCFGKTHGMNPGFERVPLAADETTLGTRAHGNHHDSATICGVFPGPEEDYYELAMARQFADFLATRDGDRPFAAQIGMLAPHPPYLPPRRFVDLIAEEDCGLPDGGPLGLRDKPALQDQRADNHWRCHPPEIRRRIVQRYAALCAVMDEALGRILDALDAHGLRDDTLVVFTSDHGDQLGEREQTGKFFSLTDAVMRVPLVVRPPAAWAPRGLGTSHHALVELVDLVPTFCAAAGVPVPAHCVGRDLRPVLGADRQDPFAVLDHRDGVFAMTEHGRCWRTRDWKLCHWYHDRHELYDLRRDPGEVHNLADDPACAAVAAHLRERLLDHLIRHPACHPLTSWRGGRSVHATPRPGALPCPPSPLPTSTTATT